MIFSDFTIFRLRRRLFDTIHDILRSLSLAQSLLKGRNSPNWRERAPTHLNLSGTEGLSTDFSTGGFSKGFFRARPFQMGQNSGFTALNLIVHVLGQRPNPLRSAIFHFSYLAVLDMSKNKILSPVAMPPRDVSYSSGHVCLNFHLNFDIE